MVDMDNFIELIQAAIYVIDSKNIPEKGREFYLPHTVRHELLRKGQQSYFEGGYPIASKKPRLFDIPIRFYTEGERLPELDLFGIEAPCLFWKGESTNCYEKDLINRITIPFFSLPLRIIE